MSYRSMMLVLVALAAYSAQAAMYFIRYLLEYDRLREGIQPALAVGSATGSCGEKGTTKR